MVAMVATDGELADSILRKFAADSETFFGVERSGRPRPSALITTSWCELTDEEAAYLDRLRQEGDQR